MDNRVKGLIGFGALLVIAVLAIVLAGGDDGDDDGGGGGGETPTELEIETLQEGEGPEAAQGDLVQVRYTGALLEDGTEFDSNESGDAPALPVTLGAGEVVPGFEQGLEGIQEGERRRLTIPSELAYGAAGSPPAIPPDAALVFEVEAESIEAGGSGGGAAPTP